MMKPQLTALLMSALVLSAPVSFAEEAAPAAAPATTKTAQTATPADVKPAAAPNAVARVMQAGLMTGYPDGKFHPEGLLSRAELAHILVKTFKLDTRTPRIAWPVVVQDVPTTHWAYNDIQTVLKNEVMEGYRENLFYPNQKITRAEAFAILAQAYGVFSWDDTMVAEELAPYPDAGQIPGWAQKAMATALHEGFVNTGEMANRIYPQQAMTRGDMAYALNRYLDRVNAPQAQPTAQ